MELSPNSTESHRHDKKKGRACFRSRVKKKKKKGGFSLFVENIHTT